MTALKDYARLEAAGLWRASPDAQRLDVFISVGDATITILDKRDQPLAHWSLAAIARANPGREPAIYHPDGDPGETLELGPDAAEVIAGIEKLRHAVARARPHPGRLRLVIFLAMIATVTGAVSFWLPDALRDHATRVLPDVKRDQIGAALRSHIERVTGPACNRPEGQRALTTLAARLPGPNGPGQIEVMRAGVNHPVSLPGGAILVNRALVEDYEEPDVLAGFIVEQRMRAKQHDPIADLLDHAGIFDSIRLLTTGALPDTVISDYAQHLLVTPPIPLADETLIEGFARFNVRTRPYAFALDVTGEDTLALIEADPFATKVPPQLLSDGDWLRLQGICGS